MTTLTAHEKQTIGKVAALLASLAMDAPATRTPKPKTPKAPKTPKTQVVDSVPDPCVQVVGRPNGLLTAISARAIQQSLLGTTMAGTKINGHSTVREACYLLTSAKVPFEMAEATVEPVVQAVELPKPTKKQRKELHRKLAELARSKGVVPQGQAWDEILRGERSWKTLRKLNAADGLTFHGVGEVPTIKAAIVAEIDEELSAKQRESVETLVEAGWTEAEALELIGV